MFPAFFASVKLLCNPSLWIFGVVNCKGGEGEKEWDDSSGTIANLGEGGGEVKEGVGESVGDRESEGEEEGEGEGVGDEEGEGEGEELEREG